MSTDLEKNLNEAVTDGIDETMEYIADQQERLTAKLEHEIDEDKLAEEFADEVKAELTELQAEEFRSKAKDEAIVKLSKHLVTFGIDGLRRVLAGASFSVEKSKYDRLLGERVTVRERHLGAVETYDAIFKPEFQPVIDAASSSSPDEWVFARIVLGVLRRNRLAKAKATGKQAKAFWKVWCRKQRIGMKVEAAPTSTNTVAELVDMLASM